MPTKIFAGVDNIFVSSSSFIQTVKDIANKVFYHRVSVRVDHEFSMPALCVYYNLLHQ